MYAVDVTIKGVTPLLQNRHPDIGEFDSKVKITNPTVDKKNEVLKKLYVIDGKIYQPSDHIWRSISNAGKDLRVKGKGKSTYSKMLASMVQVIPDAIPHKNTDFDVFSKLVINPSNKVRIPSHRPRFKDWELDFQLIVDEEIPVEVLKEALERAGRYVGIGDWRPDKKGIFGKFMVTKFQLLTED